MTLALHEIHKSYGAFHALKGVSLQANHGEFLALLGPSGCGKSTTLRVIAGLEHPDSGSVHIGDREVTSVSANKRPVNMVFQSYALFPHMSVRDNVGYGLRREGLRGAELEKRVDEGLDLVKMTAFARRKPQELSGGQQQRVALARSLVKRPEALLLDEPLGALDPTLRLHMQGELKRIQAELGITFIYVAHHQDEAFGMADRVAVMSAGRLVQLDSPEIVYRNPANAFVATFIGRLNMLPAFDGPRMDFGDDGDLICPDVSRSSGTRLGVRPECLSLTTGDLAKEGVCWLSGRVAEIVYRGPTVEIEVETRAGRYQVVTFQSAGEPPPAGTEVWIYWPVEKTICFPQSEENQSSRR